MRILETITASLLGAAIVCGFVQASPAQAQQGNVTERHIIISGPDGTHELHIDGTGLDDGAVMVVSVNGANGLFTFIGSPNDLPFGGTLGPLGLMAMASGGVNGTLVPIDPGVSYVHQLVKRADVRSDLFLDSKQREQLEAMDSAENQSNQQRIGQFNGAIKGAQGDASGNNGIANRANKLHEMVQGSADERDKKLAAILTPKQVKRLKELDLQYRGPLAMGVKPVADKALLTDKQAPVVSDLLKDYRDSVRKALGVEQNVTKSTGPDGSTNVNVNSRIDTSPDELKARLEKAHDDIEQARRSLGDKALRSIEDTQRTEWQNLTGTKFQFQTLN